jgi:predicted nuclease of predicted toxin-antitoxin system
MPRTIRFHLDENCDPRIASGLRLHGIDVTTTQEAGLLHAPDEQHLAFANSENRVIITLDADFLRIAASGQEHSGIAFYAMQSQSIGHVVRRVHQIWEVHEPEEMRNRVQYL